MIDFTVEETRIVQARMHVSNAIRALTTVGWVVTKVTAIDNGYYNILLSNGVDLHDQNCQKIDLTVSVVNVP